MKKLVLSFLIGLIFLTFSSTSSTYAEQKSPLGLWNLVMKLDYINFTEDSDNGIYAGIEGFYEILPNLYLGAEVGYADSISEDDIFIPIELNFKYALKIKPDLVLDIGAGGSYNYADDEDRGSDWVFGIQFFGDLHYMINNFFIGINVKYQVTEHFESSSYDFNNLRLGGQFGILF
ncbi:MAG: hypothetical protein ACPL1G_04120 [Thermodesulfovibrionales bacterium]